MGDHFVLLVDRLLTESTLEAAIQSKQSEPEPEPVGAAIAHTSIDIIDSCNVKHSEEAQFSNKIVECRICQDEDFDSNMEIPCSCTGTLKYAHRKCVQRWCNEKGDTVCEICHQQFKPGYTAPPPIFRVEGLTMNLRGNWQIARRDMNNNPRIIAMISARQHRLLDPEEYNDHRDSTSRSIICCRSVAIIFTILLILRHTLPVIFSHAGSYSFPVMLLVMLRIAGIVLPICLILKAVTSVLRRQQSAQNDRSNFAYDEEILHQPQVVSAAH
ncbi:uncharacterized protein LOC127260805 [Andrographis paniculata]|uniref:uncharacterized protein LOC127260805 n=1 Tax=Andrographis paniculata TaxID=175694 RepID=UPI0021E8F26E|nr:uncharacterized protein LOC127260805 [Andrographis paniculata]XP_051144703.1 uncharacterized protein LOC127260805 [Andrographis paniculata]